jgi:hypothetical protein
MIINCINSTFDILLLNGIVINSEILLSYLQRTYSYTQGDSNMTGTICV